MGKGDRGDFSFGGGVGNGGREKCRKVVHCCCCLMLELGEKIALLQVLSVKSRG